METIKDRIVSALEMHALNNPDSNYEITFPAIFAVGKMASIQTMVKK